jgi:two-component system CheB/CheR fusion protein
VFLQHLSEHHRSSMASLLQPLTSMPVLEPQDGEPLRPNHVYVMPSHVDLTIVDDRLVHVARDAAAGAHLPIDRFFCALAAARGAGAVGVVLTGTGSDGTEGLRCIQQVLGVTLAQNPDTAQFDGMPRSALAAGVVDRALSIEGLAEELARLGLQEPADDPHRDGDDAHAFDDLFAIVQAAVGVDFSEYKAPTIERRIARRMAVRHTPTLAGYVELLRGDADEVRALHDDTLIGVTSFFRDPDTFECLKQIAFPAILQAKSATDPVRMWVAGCSTGEEVFSLAIALCEHLHEAGASRPIQIFGTDVNERAIAYARNAVYSDAALACVSEERRERFFTRTDGGMRVARSVRDLCRFVRHDLARDPPFSHIDLVSCRNVLIYFDIGLQERVLGAFQYSLSNPGFLLLGRAETSQRFSHVFSPVEKAHALFRRTNARATLPFTPSLDARSFRVANVVSNGVEAATTAIDPGRHLDRVLLARFAPPAVLVDARFDVLQFRGDTGPYLSAPSGEPQTNLLKMARRGLLAALRATLTRVAETRTTVTVENVEIEVQGVPLFCNVSAAPFTAHPQDAEPKFLVWFQPVGASREAAGAGFEGLSPQARDVELVAMKDYLESLLDDHRRANEELNGANEELVSANEELQSTIEELEAAKEELQSTNEELTTVNEQLHETNDEMARLNADLSNVLATVDIPILILDRERRIRRFTPRARAILNVVASDVGRAIDDFNVHLRGLDLGAIVAGVVDTCQLVEQEVQDRDGRWFRMQVRPYRTADNRIDGATLSFIDIHALKNLIDAAEQGKSQAEQADRAKDAFLAMLSHELRAPLSAILLQAQTRAAPGADDDERLRRATEAIENGALRQAQVIEELLDVSRIVGRKLPVDFDTVDFASVVREAVAALEPLAETRSLEVQLEIDEAPTWVHGDRVRLRQVVTNLVASAIKFSADARAVRVALRPEVDTVTLVVSDAGAGIEGAFLPLAFNPFAQEGADAGHTHGGLGLGLTIVKYIVEAHGGTIAVASAGRGTGVSFSMQLPLLRGDRVTPEP